MTLVWPKGWRGIIATIAASRVCVEWEWRLIWLLLWREYGCGHVKRVNMGRGVFVWGVLPSPPSITSSFSAYIMGVRRWDGMGKWIENNTEKSRMFLRTLSRFHQTVTLSSVRDAWNFFHQANPPFTRPPSRIRSGAVFYPTVWIEYVMQSLAISLGSGEEIATQLDLTQFSSHTEPTCEVGIGSTMTEENTARH